MQPVRESTVRTINFSKIYFSIHLVAYEKLQRFDKINLSQNSLFCPTRTVAPARWPLDLRVFSQAHTDSPLKFPIYLRFGTRSEKSGPLLIEPAYRSNISFWRGSFEIFLKMVEDLDDLYGGVLDIPIAPNKRRRSDSVILCRVIWPLPLTITPEESNGRRQPDHDFLLYL